MAYSADTFVADEQPTTAKWNKLWSNDASFNDGSGLNNISNPIVANSANHLVLTPGTSKFVKVAVLRQDNTTNAYKNNSIILTGWGVVAYNTGAANVTDAVTYGITFDAAPIPVGVFGGDHGTLSTYGSGGNLVEGLLNFKMHTVTTTGFTAQVHKPSGGNFAAGNGFYQWHSIGELA